MCLAFLERIGPETLEGTRVLDFGCGTAVLALAAVRMGIAHHDPARVGLEKRDERQEKRTRTRRFGRTEAVGGRAG
jgi:ubiquinone/menaquinone biosynthesis C-methylase UbiE